MRLVCSLEAGVLGLALAEPEALDDLRIEAPAGLSLAGLGRPVDGEREELDLPAARLRELALDLGLPHAWFDDFDAMLAKVAPYGWYDESADTVRIHVLRSS